MMITKWLIGTTALYECDFDGSGSRKYDASCCKQRYHVGTIIRELKITDTDRVTKRGDFKRFHEEITPGPYLKTVSVHYFSTFGRQSITSFNGLKCVKQKQVPVSRCVFLRS